MRTAVSRITLGAAMVALLLVPAAPAHGQVIDDFTRVITWNMCGVRCNHGSLEPAHSFALHVENLNVRYAALQEVCRHQVTYIKDYLEGSGEDWNSSFYETVTLPGCDYGIAVLVRNGPYIWGGASPLPNQPGEEPRGIVCKGHYTPPGEPSIGICSTHLHAGRGSTYDDILRSSQVDAVADESEFAYTFGQQRWVAGDFNEEPNRSTLDRMYAANYTGPSGAGIHYDAHGCNPTCSRQLFHATTDTGKKYDYIFSVPSIGPPYTNYRTSTAFSDHHYFEGLYYGLD